ncbi:Tkl/drk protein kinase, variant, partial [Globisporangium splendens]
MKVMAIALVHIVAALGLICASTQAESMASLLPCSDPVFQVAYAHVVELVAACETKSDVRLEFPLTISQVQTICSTCTDLAEQVKQKQLPECEMDKSMDVAAFAVVSVQTFYEELFACSSVNATASKVSAMQRALEVEAGSSTNGGVPTPTPTPVTVTPKPTPALTPKPTPAPAPVTATPTPTPVIVTSTPTPAPVIVTPTPTPAPVTVTPTSTPTPAPETVAPSPTSTPTPTPTSSDTLAPSPSPSGSESSTSPVPSATESSSTPTTTPSSSSSGVTSNTTQASGSQSRSDVPLADGNEASGKKVVSVKMIVGFAAGIVLLVILLATFVVCRQRQRSESKLTETLLSPQTTQQGSSVPRQSTRNTTDRSTDAVTSGIRTGGGSITSNPSSQHRSHPYHHQQGELWEDEAIIAVRIPREKVVASMLLSRGGYGEVYRGVYNDQQVAIKTLLPDTRKNFKQINALLAEVKLMAELEHERIVQFLGVAWDSLTDLCVVTEYMAGGDLRATLNRFEDVEHRPHGFDHDKIKIALHISHALTYLHSLQPIVLHRDLKSKNILLDSELNAKLTDFGVSRERIDRTMTAGVGTSLWMAPEVMLGERYDDKADVFSFGVVLSELDSHVLPYSHVNESNSGHRIPDTAILQMVSLGRLRVEFSPHALPEMVELAHACVALRPRDRPTAAEVLYRLNCILKSV